jgi:hypothetical protein
MTSDTEKAAEEEIPLPPDGGGGNRRPRRDFFGATFLLAVSSAFVVQALRMPFKDPSWEWYTAPNIFPLGMATCLGAGALFVAIRGLIGWRADRAAIGPMRWAESAREWGMGRFLAGAAMIAFLNFLLGKIDFYVLAPAAIMVFGLVFRSDPLAKALKSSAIAAVFIVAFLFIISRVFGIVFP